MEVINRHALRNTLRVVRASPVGHLTQRLTSSTRKQRRLIPTNLNGRETMMTLTRVFMITTRISSLHTANRVITILGMVLNRRRTFTERMTNPIFLTFSRSRRLTTRTPHTKEFLCRKCYKAFQFIRCFIRIKLRH